MSYKERKQRRNNLCVESQTCPIIGLLDEKTTLNCQINNQSQTHKFIYSFSHPLQCITRLIQQKKKEGLQKLLLYFDLHRIELENVFLPKQLLSGNQSIMSAFKKKLQTSKINSYIKLNFLDTKIDFNHKRSSSCELTTQNIHSKSSKIQYKSLSKRFEQNNEKKINIKKQKKEQIYANAMFKQNKFNYSNLNQINTENIYKTKTVVNSNINKQKTKLKSKPLNINVSYTIIQNNRDNPESSSVYEKAYTSKEKAYTNKEKAYTSKDKVYQERRNNVDEYEQSLRIPSNATNYKNGRTQANLIATFHDEILSERMNRSVKNSQMSELTHQQNEIFYYSKQKKYQKKERKVFEVQRNC